MCIFTLKMHVMWFEMGHHQKCTSEHSQHAVHFFSEETETPTCDAFLLPTTKKKKEQIFIQMKYI